MQPAAQQIVAGCIHQFSIISSLLQCFNCVHRHPLRSSCRNFQRQVPLDQRHRRLLESSGLLLHARLQIDWQVRLDVRRRREVERTPAPL